MNTLDAIYTRLKENEEITKKFHQVESKILSILNFKDFLEELLNAIKNTFDIPYVWLSLLEGSEVQELINDIGSSDLLQEKTNTINEKAFLPLINNNISPVLENDDLRPYYKLLPDNQKYLLKSVAIAPITLDGKIIGSLNQGDVTRSRFEPGIDTSLLEQLAVKVSLCLSNVTAHEKLKFFAYHDPLTELLNRRVMEKVLKREFNRSSRYSKELSLIFLDLDKFKQINDSYGHDKGDAILKFVADTLMKMTRDIDIVSRYAGDEFVILLPETPMEMAETLMNRIKLYFQKNPFKIVDEDIFVNVSYGISSTKEKACWEPKALIKTADEKLYRIKNEKKSINSRVIAITSSDFKSKN